MDNQVYESKLTTIITNNIRIEDPNLVLSSDCFNLLRAFAKEVSLCQILISSNFTSFIFMGGVVVGDVEFLTTFVIYCCPCVLVVLVSYEEF